MKFCAILMSNHDIKKNGYAVVRKLHKLEKKKTALCVFKKHCKEGAFVVLAFQHLAEFIKDVYKTQAANMPYISEFMRKTDEFAAYLQQRASKKVSIDKRVLAGYLRAYTKFFNRVIEEHIECKTTLEMMHLWNVKCLMAYTAVWGNM